MVNIEEIMKVSPFKKVDLLKKAKELRIERYSKMTKTELIAAIEATKGIPNEKVKKIKAKKKISNAKRAMVFKKFFGTNGTGKCFTCLERISWDHFECGHVVAESNGGSDDIKNLKPVCSRCNKSMGTKNMEDFRIELGINVPKRNPIRKIGTPANYQRKWYESKPLSSYSSLGPMI